ARSAGGGSRLSLLCADQLQRRGGTGLDRRCRYGGGLRRRYDAVAGAAHSIQAARRDAAARLWGDGRCRPLMQRHRFAIVLATSIVAVAALPSLYLVRFNFIPIGLPIPNDEVVA